MCRKRASASRLPSEMGSPPALPGGHDEGRERRKRGECFEEQVVQRGVGQHDADAAHVRRNGRAAGRRAMRAPRWAVRRRQDGGFRIGNTGDAPGRFKIRHHDRQRFVRAAFAFAQQGDGFGTRCVADQMKTSKPLDRNDVSGTQGGGCPLNGALPFGKLRAGDTGIAFGGGGQPDLRPADGAGVGLGVETAVEGIVVFGGAVRAQWEAAHGRGGPVVGDGMGGWCSGGRSPCSS